MERKTFEEWYGDSTVDPISATARVAYRANDEYINHLEKQNEILMEAMEYIDKRYDLYHCDVIKQALEEIKEMNG